MPDDAQEPIGRDLAKLHLRVDGDDDDDLIDVLIVAAREFVEEYTFLTLKPATVTQPVYDLGDAITLQAWPVASLDNITVSYLAADGTTQDVPATAWRATLAACPIELIPIRCGWGVRGFGRGADRLPATVTVSAGFATPDLVPAKVKTAMLMLIRHFYDNPSAVVADKSIAAEETPLGARLLLSRWRAVAI